MDLYEWDDAKNSANRAKHGVGFELVLAFDWAAAVIRPDDRKDYGEARQLAYGRIGGRGYAIVFVVRGERIRLISLRPMHEKEARKYGA